MDLQTTTNINVDFYDKKYITINAKQYDNNSRWISIACYNNGDLFNLSAKKHTAYVRYKKADGHCVLNLCRINYRGEVLVKLTEQMLAASGVCFVDLLIVNKGSAIVDIDSGEIATIDGSSVLSTMAFCVNVYESAFDNSVVESSDEFSALNEVIQKAETDYKEIIQLAKSYAIGDANNIRENEDFDNSKYYSQVALESADSATESATEALTYYLQIAEITTGLIGAFNPKGIIKFAELATLLESGEVQVGDLYNISDKFVTDETFKKGAGIEYAAGTNVYYTSEGYWDCLIGTSVTGIKGDNEKEYRKGNVNMTADNIGAVATKNVATVSETARYLKSFVTNPDDVPNFMPEDVQSIQNDIAELEKKIGVIPTTAKSTNVVDYVQEEVADRAPMHGYGTDELEVGKDELTTGKLYFVYQEDEQDEQDDTQMFTYGTDELVAGVDELPTGKLYFVYE